MARRDGQRKPPSERGPTPQEQEAICLLVKAGLEPIRAALTQGIPEPAYERWMQKARANEHYVYTHFRDEVLQAEAECEAMLITAVRSGKNWQASVAMLERRFPERWLRRSVNGERSDRPDGRPMGGGDPFADLDNVVPMNRREKR